jgi:protein SCO1/2
MNQRVVVGVVAVIALILGVIGALYIAPPDLDKTEVRYFQAYPEARNIAPFVLTNHHGETFSETSLKDQWSLIFLGYTFCPDICPTTMEELNRIYPQLQQLPTENPIKVVFVSVDPKRDTVPRLADYVGYFNQSFIGLTGEHKDLFPFARNLGMMYAIAESTDKPDYLVDHSASIVLVNPKAQAVGRFKPKREPGKLSVSDAEQILADMPAIIAAQ